jgi:nucleotide-binding universal stress UspA family protein
VVRAWSPPTPRLRAYDFDEAVINAAEQAWVDDLLTQWRQKYPELVMTTEIVAGDPAHAMIEASRTAQIVVVGSRGRGGFRGLLLGSVSQHLIHHGECPVAIVRELAQPDPETDLT